MSTTNNNFRPDYLVLPGETLQEVLEDLNMSQAELAKRIARPVKTINEIINGVSAITPDTAIQLETALGVPASFWNNLEKIYQENKARLKFNEIVKTEVPLVKKYPYNEMVKLGWVEPTKDSEQKVYNLLSYFGVSSLSSIPQVMNVAFRQHSIKNLSIESVIAWLRKGDLDATKIETKPFDEKKLRAILPDIKALSREIPNIFQSKLQELLSECGIALVFTPNLNNTSLCGATKWINPNKALIQLSLRGGYEDIMWFTLFHELGHILIHKKREKFVDFEKNNTDITEEQADKFAAEALIVNSDLKEFINDYGVNRSAIQYYAETNHINAGIVVGRLQHLGIIERYKLNDLRPTFKSQKNQILN